jgi:regulator of sigma E protease
VLSAKDSHGTFDFPLDLRGVSEKDVDDDFMSHLGFEPGGGKLIVAGVQAGQRGAARGPGGRRPSARDRRHAYR